MHDIPINRHLNVYQSHGSTVESDSIEWVSHTRTLSNTYDLHNNVVKVKLLLH